MSVNFPKLLQESWNFIINRKPFSLFAIGLFLIVQIVGSLAMPTLPMTSDVSNVAASEAVREIPPLSVMLPSLVTGVLNIYISVLIILNIKSINDGQFANFFQNAPLAFTKLFPAIGLYLFMVLPISVGAASFMTMGANGNIVALPLMVTGIFVFLKLCLSIYALLVEAMPFRQAVKFTWQFTKGKMWTIVLYYVIAHFVPQLILIMFTSFGDSLSTRIVLFLVSAFFTLFTAVLGFRFYQTLRQQTHA